MMEARAVRIVRFIVGLSVGLAGGIMLGVDGNAKDIRTPFAGGDFKVEFRIEGGDEVSGVLRQ